jgi:hypothetical protein
MLYIDPQLKTHQNANPKASLLTTADLKVADPVANAYSRFRDSTAQTEELALWHPNEGHTSGELYRAMATQHLGNLLSQSGDTAGARRAFLESAAIAESNVGGGSAFLNILIACRRQLVVIAIKQGHRASPGARS